MKKPSHNLQAAFYLRFRQNLIARTMGIFLVCSITACSQRVAQNSSLEVDGTQPERVAKITQLLIRTAPLPGPLLDAHFIKEQTGGGGLGPSDFRSFYAIKVAPADLPAWKAALSKSKAANTFSNDDEIKRTAPKKAQPWWVNAADLGKLEFFSPHSLTGSANGWVGIAPDGRIFIYVFTM